MNRVIVGVIVSAVVLGGLVFMGQKSSNTVQPDAEKISFSTVTDKVSDGSAVLVDVRTEEEFNEGHINSAVLHPLQLIESGKFPTDKKDQKIFVYCRSGNRSAQATSLLNKAGYKNVVDLGGMSDVVAIGGKTCSSNEC